MKDGFENIDEIFKQAFDGFESNVDPSVWNNVQSSISSGTGSTPQVDPFSAVGVVGKSLALKIIAGVALVAAVATGAYYIPSLFENTENNIIENVVEKEDAIEAIEEIPLPVIANEQGEVVVAENEIAANPVFPDEDVVVNENRRVETIELERQEDPSSENTEQTTQEEKVKKNPVKNTNTTVTKPVKKLNKTTKKVDNLKISVKINVDVVKGKAPLTVQFDAIGIGTVAYFWDFSDDTDEINEESPVHTFMNEGTYRVKLSGLDKEGNYKEDYITIIVEKDYSSSIKKLPNVFTPNGDGLNDFIKVRGKNISRIQVKILNSKGTIVYFMNSLEDVWEGKDQNGNLLNQGQYYMLVTAIGTDGKQHVVKQFVNLLK